MVRVMETAPGLGHQGLLQGQSGACPDAQGRRDHGRRHARARPHRAGGRRVRRDGPRAGARRHPQGRRRRAHVRPGLDPVDHGGGDHPGHGEVPDRPLRRGADPPGAGHRLHRRVRGAHPGRRGEPHRQAPVQGAVRVRLPGPRRGDPPDRRRRGDDPHQGRGGHRQRGRGRPPRARGQRRASASSRA